MRQRRQTGTKLHKLPVQNASMNAKEQAISQLEIETGTEHVPDHIL
jgi:hypothetical protein